MYVWNIEYQVGHAGLFGHQIIITQISIIDDDNLTISERADEGIRIWDI